MDKCKSYGVASFLAQSDAVGITVLFILLVMSVASWYLIVLKTVRGRQLRSPSPTVNALKVLMDGIIRDDR